MSDDLSALLARFVDPTVLDARRVHTPKPRRQIDKEKRARKQEAKLRNIAVLDMETDPFDASRPAERIQPFCACLYSENFEPVIIWNEDLDGFVNDVLSAIEALPDEYTIFAHNGGKFDWQFLLYRLRGQVSFKGRGLMAAKIGRHSIRDSFHLLPEKLASYRKDAFDYKKMKKSRRNKYRAEIIDYLLADCRYLLELLTHFVREHGIKLSIGQAAMVAMKGAGYDVENLAENSDAYMRHFYFGGRVECIAGKGEFTGPYKLFDVNSMYPSVMAAMKHPISRAFEVRDGLPGPNTIFVDLTCDNNGALVARGPDGETSPINGRHRFKTTVHEYNVALKYGLISDVIVHWCVDFDELSTFERFVVPRYQRRLDLKEYMKSFNDDVDNPEYQLAKRNDLTEKYLLNNSYGKYAQNPRKYKESFITDYGQRPPHEALDDSIAEWGELPAVRNQALGYSIWEKPVDRLRFRNVATAASITGAARAVLLEAMCNAVDPIYCDTDSLICRDLINTDLHKSRLGAWDLEDTFASVVIIGKKSYACDRGADKPEAKRYKVRSKGTSGMTYAEQRQLLADEAEPILKRNAAPTLSRGGNQVYIARRIRATAAPANAALLAVVNKRRA